MRLNYAPARSGGRSVIGPSDISSWTLDHNRDQLAVSARRRSGCSVAFARIGAVIQMKVGDYFVQGRRRWLRLHEKGGKEHDVPCHHRLDQCLHDYIEAA